MASFPSLAGLARLGLVGGIDPVGGRLQEKAPQRGGRLEEGGAHQHFQWLDGQPVEGLPLKLRHHLADCLVLGQAEVRRGVFFFFEPAARSARVF